MFQIFFAIIYWLIQIIQPMLIPFCFILSWLLVLLTAWSIWSTFRDGIANAKRMHKIPCANCQYFTGDYHLKCTVRPTMALSEAAIDCVDYAPPEPFGLVKLN
jgi:hypothetical protein